MSVYGASRLANVDPDLVRIVTAVGVRRNVQVVQGARSIADELKAMASHHSALRNPMNSKHVIDPQFRPVALAVDLAPWPVNWNDIPGFVALALVVKSCALELGIPIVWGGDWTTIKDYDHYELSEAS